MHHNHLFNDEKLYSIVKDFFQKIHADDLLQSLFKDHDEERIQHHPKTFLSQSLGEAKYTDTDIAEAHKHVAVNNDHFESMVNHFIQTLDDHGFAEEDKRKISDVLNGYKKDVLGT
jgi:hemoglobin